MKFRAVIDDTASMRDFMNIINSLSKLAKEGVMRLSRGIVYFIIFDEEERTRKLLVWCELPVNYYFRAYNLEGVNEEHNEIYLAFTTGMLAKSMATLKQNAKSLKIKLTDKQVPCLTLEIELDSNDGFGNRQFTHDIPVDVIARKHWCDYEQPTFQDFHVSIEMPQLKRIKNIVERMRSMSPSLIVNANKFGRLTLKIKTNMVTLSAHFEDLEVQSFVIGHTIQEDENEEEYANDQSTVTATVDIKKFHTFLTGMHINNNQTTCSIVHNSMVKLALTQPNALSLQFYLTELSL